MKLMNKLQNRKEELKKDNKGFSLVELIIVIAIMAILVGIVGTQVIPYISKSKASKDQQVLNSISTAAVAAYSENAVTGDLTIDVFGTDLTTSPGKEVQAEIRTSSGFKDLPAFRGALGADGKEDIDVVKVTFSATTHKATTEVVYKANKTPKYPIKKVEATI